jgi:hypothetical protein
MGDVRLKAHVWVGAVLVAQTSSAPVISVLGAPTFLTALFAKRSRAAGLPSEDRGLLK